MHEPVIDPSSAKAAGWAPVLGPVDRTHFAAEQGRRRRDTWRLLALCALAVGLTGIPQSAIITPIVFALAFAVARLAGAPPSAMDAFRDLALTAWRSIEYLIDNMGPHPTGVPRIPVHPG